MKKTITILALAFTTLNAFSQIPSWIPNPGVVGTLQAYYGFDGNTNDMTTNALHLLNSGAVLTTDRFGDANSAYNFNGSTDYMTRFNFPASTVGLFAISVWIKRDATFPNTGIAVQKGQYTSVNNISTGALLIGNANMESRMYIGGSPVQATSSNVGFNSNWNHVVLDYDGVNLYCFINGVANGVIASLSPNNTISDLSIGTWKLDGVNSYFFDGKIDDVAIYSGPLTTCEVRDMYNSCTLTQPASHSAVDGTTTQFVVTNDCFDSSSLTYQWQLHTGTAYANLINTGQFSGVTTNTLTISNVSPANNNTLYRCIIDNGAGCTKATTGATLTVSNVGIEEAEESNAFGFSPNPAQNSVAITVLPDLLNEQYSIFNVVGANVMDGKFTDLTSTIDLSELPNGVYTVQVAEKYNKRLVVNK
ncbi:MAG: T9SS type A sorting domain-containing protein [Bacteroidetes bacterium]|nr:T9SS type A sorting domain-containing protein [Bacteroidota bacterium]